MDHKKLWEIYRDGNIRPPYLYPEKTAWGKEKQLEPYMEQLTGSKLGKQYNKAVYFDPVCLIYLQSIL